LLLRVAAVVEVRCRLVLLVVTALVVAVALAGIVQAL
jgi:hypothetical protein